MLAALILQINSFHFPTFHSQKRKIFPEYFLHKRMVFACQINSFQRTPYQLHSRVFINTVRDNYLIFGEYIQKFPISGPARFRFSKYNQDKSHKKQAEKAITHYLKPCVVVFIHRKVAVETTQNGQDSSYSSTVKSCVKTEDCYEVICEDSILFPEGGGQPSDTGYINDIPVYKVLRRGEDAVMFVRQPLTVGEEVIQKVDWERRFDHMQQHSGQHLITAVINSEYKIDTTSWWLGEKTSHIELNTKQLSPEQISNIEKLVNEKILQQIPVMVKYYELEDAALQNARTRGLPSDVVEPIRVVEIVGIDDDLCCGTHVSNLCQLQCIKLLYAEKGKKDKTNLFFLSGGRVLKCFTECLNREQKLTGLLKNEPASHPELVEKLMQNVKITRKKLTVTLKDLAALEAGRYKTLDPRPKYYFHYNREGDSDYLDSFVRSILAGNFIDQTFFMLASGEEKGNGNLMLLGNEDDLKELGPKVVDILDGKGAVHGVRFQAKVSRLCKFKKAEAVVREYFNSKEA